jgi:hypothetical protein
LHVMIIEGPYFSLDFRLNFIQICNI